MGTPLEWLTPRVSLPIICRGYPLCMCACASPGVCVSGRTAPVLLATPCCGEVCRWNNYPLALSPPPWRHDTHEPPVWPAYPTLLTQWRSGCCV